MPFTLKREPCPYFINIDCYQKQVPVPTTQWGQTKRNVGVWNIEFYCRATQGECLAHAQKTLNSSKGFRKLLLKARWGRGEVRCCKLLGIGVHCSCSCARINSSDHYVPINLQQDKCYSLFCNFLYEWTLKGQSLENGLSCTFQATGNILLQKVQSQRD